MTIAPSLAPVFAIGLSSGNVAQFFVNVLAVAGGFLVGWMLTGFLAWLLERRIIRLRTPYGSSPVTSQGAPGLRKIARILGGIALAILVALIVFGKGSGWTIGGGGGEGEGKKDANPDGPGGPDKGSPVSTEPERLPPATSRTPAPNRERVRITVLGGEAVKDQRFYLLDDDSTPRNFAEARATLAARKESAKLPLGIEIQFSAENAISQNHPAVLNLTRWAKENDVTVTFPAEGR